MIRLSRPCYDKPHRCPGWVGGGFKYAERVRCDNGTIRVPARFDEAMLVAIDAFNPHPIAHPFRFGSCGTCNVVTIPWAWTYLDPSRFMAAISSMKRRTRWAIEDRWRR